MNYEFITYGLKVIRIYLSIYRNKEFICFEVVSYDILLFVLN